MGSVFLALKGLERQQWGYLVVLISTWQMFRFLNHLYPEGVVAEGCGQGSAFSEFPLF